MKIQRYARARRLRAVAVVGAALVATAAPSLRVVATSVPEPPPTDSPPAATLPGGDLDPTPPGDLPNISNSTRYTVAIGNAEISCDGVIKVDYATSASPDPEQAAASHLFVLNPASDPGAFQVVETTGNPATGTFTFELATTPVEPYRLLVIAQLEPGDPEGPTDHNYQVDVLVADGC